jgi:hypothetical protein
MLVEPRARANIGVAVLLGCRDTAKDAAEKVVRPVYISKNQNNSAPLRLKSPKFYIKHLRR